MLGRFCRVIRPFCLALGLLGPAMIARAQANPPEGFEIVDLVHADWFAGFPAINNCGLVAFDLQLGRAYESKEMFLYDNGSLTRLTFDDVSDRVPRMNDAGVMVWLRRNNPDDTELVLYRDGQMTIFDRHRRGLSGLDINNLDQIVWDRYRKSECALATDLLFWNGENVLRITGPDDMQDSDPHLTDDGWIAWWRENNCNNPWTAIIRVYADGQIFDLPTEVTQNQSPTVNNLYQVAWAAAGVGIELWQDGRTVILARDGQFSVPRFNHLGDLYYAHADPERRVWQPWLYRVSGGTPTFHRLRDDAFSASRGDVNEWGEVAWRSSLPENIAGKISLMRRIRTGDAQFDGRVDLADFSKLARCITGPHRSDGLCECRFLDLDHDGDVDLMDFARFQNGFEGS